MGAAAAAGAAAALFLQQAQGAEVAELWQRASSSWGAGPEQRVEPDRPERRYRDARRPLRPVPLRREQPAIFVGIASFKDVRCGRTLFQAFSRAMDPHRVFVGVVDQADPEDKGCLDVYCSLMEKRRAEPRVAALWEAWRRERAVHAAGDAQEGAVPPGPCPMWSHVKQMFLDYRHSKGPCPARAVQQSLVDDEDFCLQVDAHSSFATGWDDFLVADWRRCDNEYAVLTTYPPGDQDVSEIGEPRNVNGHWEVPHLCSTDWTPHDRRVVRNAPAAAAWMLDTPKLTTVWAAGFSFSRCHAEVNVPYDPHLRQLFTGEEFSRATRLWTSGYDLYTPTRSVVFHDYGEQAGKPTGPADAAARWTRRNTIAVARELQISTQRLLSLWQFDPRGSSADGYPPFELQPLGRFGLGIARSYAAWVNFSGVDPARHIASGWTRCGNVEWEPYNVLPPNEYNYAAPDDGFSSDEDDPPASLSSEEGVVPAMAAPPVLDHGAAGAKAATHAALALIAAATCVFSLRVVWRWYVRCHRSRSKKRADAAVVL